jgi:hypothetical protein
LEFHLGGSLTAVDDDVAMPAPGLLLVDDHRQIRDMPQDYLTGDRHITRITCDLTIQPFLFNKNPLTQSEL